jgi:virginiamycin B lyase
MLGVLIMLVALAACGGGGGGASIPSSGGGGGATPTPTAAPPTGAIGDVHAVTTVGASPAIAYDDDDRTLFIVQGRGFATVGGTFSIVLPASDNGSYISAVAYSAHALYFASLTTVYRATTNGAVSTVAGGFANISGIAVDPSGTVYAVDGDHVSVAANGAARVLTPPGTINTTAPGITQGIPQLVFDSHDGALYVTDPFDTQIKRVTTSGSVSAVAGSCVSYSGGGHQSCWPGMSAGSGSAARFGSPSGIAYDASADLFYVSDAYDNVLWTMTPGGSTAIAAGYGAYGSADGNGRHALLFAPVGVALGGNGLLYLDQLDIFTARSTVSSYATHGTAPPAGTFPAVELPTPSTPSQPQKLAGAPDGTAWITEGFAGKVAHVTATGITEFSLPSGYSSPYKIAVDANGTPWVTAYAVVGAGIPIAPAVVHFASGGTATAYTFGAQGGQAEIGDIAIGSDGNPWFSWFLFSASSTASIKSIDRTTGTVTDHPAGTSKVRALSAGPDGNIWFTTFPSATNVLSRMAPDGHLVGQPFTVSHQPIAMTPNPADSSLWYVDGAVTLGRIDQNGTETDIPLCSACNAQPQPAGVAPAPDGSVWFVEDNPSDLAHRDTSGHITRYLLPAFNQAPSGVAVRADGKVWVATVFGTVYLFDPAAYDAFGLPHAAGNASAGRAPHAVDRRALFGAAGGGASNSRPVRRP